MVAVRGHDSKNDVRQPVETRIGKPLLLPPRLGGSESDDYVRHRWFFGYYSLLVPPVAYVLKPLTGAVVLGFLDRDARHCGRR